MRGRAGGVVDGALLRRRAEGLRERMDDPDCDPARLRRTYAQFAVLNRLLAGWDRVWARRLRPVALAAVRARGRATLLDVGCGGGDLARALAARAAREGLPLRVTGLDPDARALAYARTRATPPTVRYRAGRAEDLVATGERFDLVVSNHVVHHLPSDAVPAFLGTTGRLARRLALHNDLRRDPLALPAFAAFSLPFRGSFIAEDGFRSIRRAFTREEAAALAPPPWRIEPLRPFRHLWILERRAGPG